MRTASETNACPGFGSGIGRGRTACNKNIAHVLQGWLSFTLFLEPAKRFLPPPMGGKREQKID